MVNYGSKRQIHHFQSHYLSARIVYKGLSWLQILLAFGADVNAGLNERSPLHYAVMSDAADVVDELLSAGASPDTPQVHTITLVLVGVINVRTQRISTQSTKSRVILVKQLNNLSQQLNAAC